MDKISIIVPVYNVEKYLDRCIESIINQSYKNLEIILINDGSTDGSGAICEEWKKRDSRIVVFHKENGGASSARNVGLDYATGEYIGFVDSDDWTEPMMYQRLYQLIKEHDAEIAVCDSVKTTKNSEIQVEILSRTEHLNRFFRVNDNPPVIGLWRRLIKKELLEGYSFIEGRMNEDIHTSYWLAHKSCKTVQTNEQFYHYFRNVEGVTNSAFSEKKMDLIYIWDIVKQMTSELSPEYLEVCDKNCKRARFTLLCQMHINGYDKKDVKIRAIKKMLKKEVRASFYDLMRWKMSLSRKILLIFVCI